MFGGERQSTQRWRTSCYALLPLARRCDGAHVHKRMGWRTNKGRWPPSATAEGAYPRDLCVEAAACLASAYLTAAPQALSPPAVAPDHAA
eukprot:5128875-Alexandrium_andersonii.AAC.1